MAKTVDQAMTPNPQTVQRWTAIKFAAQVMERENVGSLPVVEEDGALAGIVTDRDIVTRVVAAGKDIDQAQVGAILSEDPQTVAPDEPLEDRKIVV